MEALGLDEEDENRRGRAIGAAANGAAFRKEDRRMAVAQIERASMMCIKQIHLNIRNQYRNQQYLSKYTVNVVAKDV